MTMITRRQLREKSNPAMRSSTSELDEVLQVLEDSYSKIRETVITLGTRHCLPELECLTEGLASEPFKRIIRLSNALRNIVITLIQGFPQPLCHKGLGINNEENDIRVNKIARLLQLQCLQTTEHRNSNYKLNGASRHDDHEFTLHNPSMDSRQPGELKADTSPEETPLLEDATTISQNCLVSFTSSDIGESASACGIYDTIAQVAHPGSVNRNLIGESRDTSQQYPDPETTADNAIKWTAINTKGPLTHRNVTKGVPCPIKTCPRNGRSPPKYFARADNLGGHLRKVHGIHIPSRARVRHWITGNKSQVLLQAAEEKTKELRELGILGADGTWEPPGI